MNAVGCDKQVLTRGQQTRALLDRGAGAKRDARACMALLGKAGTICEMAYEVDDIIDDPTARENGFFADVDTPEGARRTVATPMMFSRTPARPRGPAPELGQNTEEVLLEVGYSWEDIAALRDKGVV